MYTLAKGPAWRSWVTTIVVLLKLEIREVLVVLNWEHPDVRALRIGMHVQPAPPENITALTIELVCRHWLRVPIGETGSKWLVVSFGR